MAIVKKKKTLARRRTLLELIEAELSSHFAHMHISLSLTLCQKKSDKSKTLNYIYTILLMNGKGTEKRVNLII